MNSLLCAEALGNLLFGFSQAMVEEKIVRAAKSSYFLSLLHMRTGFRVTKIYWMKSSALFRIQMLRKNEISVKDFGATKWVSVGTGAWEVSSSVDFPFFAFSAVV